jgi:hypothetical protein
MMIKGGIQDCAELMLRELPPELPRDPARCRGIVGHYENGQPIACGKPATVNGTRCEHCADTNPYRKENQ